jgi:predicted small lipoprotein YifL
MTLRTFTGARLLPAGAVLLLLAAPLGACGKLGQLEKPSALNGAGRATERQADAQQRQVQDPQRPVDTVDPRDRNVDPAPPRTLPIPGSGQDPFASGPPGALPNPYANPR